MVGRALTEQYPKERVEAGKEVLRVEGLSKRGVCTDVSFSLRRGEILGLAGLVGAGRTEIVELIYGAKRRDSRRIFVDRREGSIPSTRDAVHPGIAPIPQGRKKQGLLLGM